MLQSYYLKLNCHSWVHVLSSLSLALGVLLKASGTLKDGSWLAEVGHQRQALQVVALPVSLLVSLLRGPA